MEIKQHPLFKRYAVLAVEESSEGLILDKALKATSGTGINRARAIVARTLRKSAEHFGLIEPVTEPRNVTVSYTRLGRVASHLMVNFLNNADSDSPIVTGYDDIGTEMALTTRNHLNRREVELNDAGPA